MKPATLFTHKTYTHTHTKEDTIRIEFMNGNNYVYLLLFILYFIHFLLTSDNLTVQFVVFVVGHSTVHFICAVFSSMKIKTQFSTSQSTE